MFRRRILHLTIVAIAGLVSLMVVLPAAAASQTADATPKPAPARYYLGQLKYSVQTLNNCGPASVVAAMSDYGINVSQETARQVLRPYTENRGMSFTVISPYVAQFGLQAKVLIDGHRDVIKSLVANGIPVIVSQWVSESWHTGHYRVVQGYDDAKGVFYVDDSLLGPNVSIPYDSFDARWDYNWSRYIPVYRPSQAALVDAILGPDATETAMFARRVPALQAAVDVDPSDRLAFSRLVEALTGSEQYQEALDTLDAFTLNNSFSPVGPSFFGGRSLANPTRLKLLNKLGRYEEALADVEAALTRVGSRGWNNGSLWLQKAEALRGLGRTDEARAAYQQAVQADGTISEAGQRLATLSG